jgi:hypothetical protein
MNRRLGRDVVEGQREVVLVDGLEGISPRRIRAKTFWSS